MDLTEGQQKAIKHIRGPSITIAGPGAGKTFVITERVKNLIENHHIDPKNILVTTFTEKAANELKVRLVKLWDCDEELDEVIDYSYKKSLEILKKQNLMKQVFGYSGIE
jgi:ATP-dependent DNA helicase UvrD/PcrA